MQRESVNSSNIRAMGYDPATEILEIDFHASGVYRFPQVKPDEYKALKEADSIGRHFVKHFKDRACEKV